MDLEQAAAPKVVQIGVSRPPLEVDDLPTPEEVFQRPKLGVKEVVFYVMGPSLIALGISIGSGEWLLGPLNVATYGFIGTGFVILLSILLQTFWNMEIGRYIIATGEVPSLGFARVPPGWIFWVPVSLFIIYLAFLWGGWAASAGMSLFALLTGGFGYAGGRRPLLPAVLFAVGVYLSFTRLLGVRLPPGILPWE